jgi:hypothetical protein
MAKISFFTDPEKYFELIFDPTESIQSITIINEDMVAVTHTKEDEFAEVLSEFFTISNTIPYKFFYC